MNDTETPSLLILLLTWNQWPVTAACLQALAQLTYPDFQLLVVDNGSTDETVTRLQADFPEVALIENGRNLGFAAGCNVGLRWAVAAGYRYVLLLNNDTMMSPDMVTRLMAVAVQLPDLGAASPALRYLEAPETVWFAGSRRHPLTLEAVDFGADGPRRHTDVTVTHPVDYIFGTAMLLSTAVLADVGFFDEQFFLYYEEMDYCLRLQQAGYQVYYVAETAVYHHRSASTEGLSAIRYYHRARSSVIFFRKHGRRWRRWLIGLNRLFSGLRTVLRLLWQREAGVALAYGRGVWDGLRHRLE